MTTLQKTIIAIYLDYINNYLTVQTMSKAYLMTYEQMNRLVMVGKELHDEHTQLKLDLLAL